MKTRDFTTVTEFENKIAEFFGAPYAVAVDSCTHGIELCLRYSRTKEIFVPKRTYISIPFLALKLGIRLTWEDYVWKDYYYLTQNTESLYDENIIDAAVLWKKDSYLPGTFTNLSFQFQKHLNLVRGGMILTDNEEAAIELRMMSYDGRIPVIPWREQNIQTVGYHYYMTPETARLGLDKLDEAIEAKPRQWVIEDWPDISKMDVFKNH